MLDSLRIVSTKKQDDTRQLKNDGCDGQKYVFMMTQPTRVDFCSPKISADVLQPMKTVEIIHTIDRTQNNSVWKDDNSCFQSRIKLIGDSVISSHYYSVIAEVGWRVLEKLAGLWQKKTDGRIHTWQGNVNTVLLFLCRPVTSERERLVMDSFHHWNGRALFHLLVVCWIIYTKYLLGTSHKQSPAANFSRWKSVRVARTGQQLLATLMIYIYGYWLLLFSPGTNVFESQDSRWTKSSSK